MKKLLTFISIIFIISCGDKVREEITERHKDGKKETVIEKIEYNQNCDTLSLEKPLDSLKMDLLLRQQTDKSRSKLQKRKLGW